jgi:hypothetical protein
MTSVMLAVLLLVSASSVVSAQCGWVLWVYQKYTAPGRGSEVEWFIHSAFDGRDPCNNGRRALIKEDTSTAPSSGWNRTVSDEYVIEMNRETQARKSTRYICLPAGTDPQPRYKE